MHLRKTRKAKDKASEFVRRVISGRDVSPDHTVEAGASKPATETAGTSRGRKPPAAKQASKAATRQKRSESKSPSRASPSCSPGRSRDPGASATRTSSRTRSNSRSPVRSQEPKTVVRGTARQKACAKSKGPVPSQNKALDNVRSQSRSKSKSPCQDLGQAEDSAKASTSGSTKRSTQPAKAEVQGAPKAKTQCPVASQASSKAPKLAAVDTKPVKKDCNQDAVPTTSASCEVKPQVITPKIVFVETGRQASGEQVTTSAVRPMSTLMGTAIKLSPKAKLIPSVSLPPGAIPGKNVYTISVPSGSSLAKMAGQTAQIIVSSPQKGIMSGSPIKVITSTSGSGTSPTHIKLDLMELARTVTAMSTSGSMITSASSSPVTAVKPAQEKHEKVSLSINKSPKLLLSDMKLCKTVIKEEPQDKDQEGTASEKVVKIKKQKRPKMPNWERPSAVYQTQYDTPQPKWECIDEPISYPADSGMGQKEYFNIVRLINKADIKKTDGTEHRNHRLAGGKLRRVCKPKIAPEMVYRRFSLARGCIMHDVYEDSDEEDGNSPKVTDKNQVIKTEQTKKRSLSPKMSDSYRQHCNKIPLISIEKVAKDDGESGSENSPLRLVKGNSFKENEPPSSAKRLDFESGEGCSSSKPKKKHEWLKMPEKKLAKSSQGSPSSSKGPSSKGPSQGPSGQPKKLVGGKGTGKQFTRAKSFDFSEKKVQVKTKLAKSKSFEKCAGTSKVSPKGKDAKTYVSSSKAGPAKVGTSRPWQPPVREPEIDDGTKRRSARQRSGKRKEWWHLLRANPDEFEEDKEWEKEVADQEKRRNARIEKQERIKAEDDDDDDEEGEEEEDEDDEEQENHNRKRKHEESEDENEDEPTSKHKKSATNKKKASPVKLKTEPECDEEDVNAKSYADLYESKLKYRKRRKPQKDWALAKKVLEEAYARQKAQDDDDGEESIASQESDISAAGNSFKGSKKFKEFDRQTDDMGVGMKKIKTEPDMLNKKASVCLLGTKKKSKKCLMSKQMPPPKDEKPLETSKVVILGEDGEPLEEAQHQGLYGQLRHVVSELVRDPQKLSQSGVVELRVPLDSPQSFIEVMARQMHSLQRPFSPYGELPIIREDLGYKTRACECIAPHMCSVCWINDHMYCRNMKRSARDLPLCGGCIHYVPCPHYRQQDNNDGSQLLRGNRKKEGRKARYVMREVQPERYSLDVNTRSDSQANTEVKKSDSENSDTLQASEVNVFPSPSKGAPQKSKKVDTEKGLLSGEDLLCDEVLPESDSEPNSPVVPPGTEMLKTQLRVRASQIKKSLGFSKLPKTISPLKRQMELARARYTSPPPSCSHQDAEDSLGEKIDVTEYAFEIVIGDDVQDPDAEADYGVPLSEEYCVKEGASQSRSSHYHDNECESKTLRIKIVPPREGETPSDMHTVEIESSGEGTFKLHVPRGEGHESKSDQNAVRYVMKQVKREDTPVSNMDWDESRDGSEFTGQSVSTASSQCGDSQASEPEGLVGEPQVAWYPASEKQPDGNPEQSKTQKGKKKLHSNKKKQLDLASVCSEESSASSVTLTKDARDAPAEGTGKTKWIPGKDGTQVLTFTTKEIRERKPELLDYVKRAGLVDVITEKLNQEYSLVNRVVKEKEGNLCSLQRDVEQSRCLLAAVQSEIVAVKDQLGDLQKQFIEAESFIFKSRKQLMMLSEKGIAKENRLSVFKRLISGAAKGRARKLQSAPGGATEGVVLEVLRDGTKQLGTVAVSQANVMTVIEAQTNRGSAGDQPPSASITSLSKEPFEAFKYASGVREGTDQPEPAPVMQEAGLTLPDSGTDLLRDPHVMHLVKQQLSVEGVELSSVEDQGDEWEQAGKDTLLSQDGVGSKSNPIELDFDDKIEEPDLEITAVEQLDVGNVLVTPMSHERGNQSHIGTVVVGDKVQNPMVMHTDTDVGQSNIGLHQCVDIVEQDSLDVGLQQPGHGLLVSHTDEVGLQQQQPENIVMQQTDILMQQSDNIPKQQNDVLVQQCNDGLVQQCDDVLMQQSNDAAMQQCEDVWVQQCDDVLMQQSNDAAMQQCEDGLVQQCDDVLVQQSNDAVVQQCEDVLVQQPDDVLVQQPDDVLVQQPDDVMLQQPDDVLVQQPDDVMLQQPDDVLVQQPDDVMLQQPDDVMVQQHDVLVQQPDDVLVQQHDDVMVQQADNMLQQMESIVIQQTQLESRFVQQSDILVQAPENMLQPPQVESIKVQHSENMGSQHSGNIMVRQSDIDDMVVQQSDIDDMVVQQSDINDMVVQQTDIESIVMPESDLDVRTTTAHQANLNSGVPQQPRQNLYVQGSELQNIALRVGQSDFGNLVVQQSDLQNITLQPHQHPQPNRSIILQRSNVGSNPVITQSGMSSLLLQAADLGNVVIDQTNLDSVLVQQNNLTSDLANVVVQPAHLRNLVIQSGNLGNLVLQPGNFANVQVQQQNLDSDLGDVVVQHVQGMEFADGLHTIMVDQSGQSQPFQFIFSDSSVVPDGS